MKPIQQKNPLGCGVACVAFILNINYQDALSLFKNGERKANEIGFSCKEIRIALEKVGQRYKYRHIKHKIKNKIYKQNTIVFLKKSKKYPYGHYLCRVKDCWMDPWINSPSRRIKAGFRKRLPETPTYFIYPA